MPLRICAAFSPSSKPRSCRAVTSLLRGVGLASLLSLCSLASVPSARAQSLQAGDVLLDSYDGSFIQRYSASGTLEQTYTGTGATGTTWFGLGLTPDGNIVTTFRYPNTGIAIFRPDGTQIASFLTPAVVLPTDVSVFADGTIAVSDAGDPGTPNPGQPGVYLYSQTGTLLKTITTPNLLQATGSTIAPDNTLWVSSEASSAGRLFHFTESGTLLQDLWPGGLVDDLVVDPNDGTLWVNSEFHGIYHLNAADGSPNGIAFINTNLARSSYGIGISPDGKTLYSTADQATVIQEFDTNGLTTGSITLVNPHTPSSLLVVPRSFGISANAPEPGSLALVGVGCSVLGVGGFGVRRRRRNSERTSG